MSHAQYRGMEVNQSMVVARNERQWLQKYKTFCPPHPPPTHPNSHHIGHSVPTLLVVETLDPSSKMASTTRLVSGLLLLLTTLLPFTSAAPSSGCGRTPSIRSQQYSMTVNGKSRQYFVKLPDNYDSSRPYRLIFTWHQLGGSAQKIVDGENTNAGGVLPYYGLPPLANNSAIFVVPNGLNAGWANQNGEDVTFFDQLLKTVSDGLCVDTSLVFSTGFSYGGAMSYSLACSRPQQIRAVAVISGSLLSGCAGGTEPVAYYAQHGTSDSVLNVSGGRSIRDTFVRNNGCTPVSPEPQPGSGGRSVKTVYKNCKADKPVTWVIHGGDHNPSQTDDGRIFAPANTWEFFSQFAGSGGGGGGGGGNTGPTTTLVTITTTASNPQPTYVQPGTVPQWGQCGGNGWTGGTVCIAPFTCKKQNDWYSQCL